MKLNIRSKCTRILSSSVIIATLGIVSVTANAALISQPVNWETGSQISSNASGRTLVSSINDIDNVYLLDAFDSALGTLNSVYLSAIANVTGNGLVSVRDDKTSWFGGSDTAGSVQIQDVQFNFAINGESLDIGLFNSRTGTCSDISPFSAGACKASTSMSANDVSQGRFLSTDDFTDLLAIEINVSQFAKIEVKETADTDGRVVFHSGAVTGNGMFTLVYDYTKTPVVKPKPPVTDVPAPSTLAIFALGLMGLASRGFKKQS
ncbi:MAG: hypothetical protein ACJA13_001287 [Paraglaciecola sp.]|jgi:hypothetical protein